VAWYSASAGLPAWICPLAATSVACSCIVSWPCKLVSDSRLSRATVAVSAALELDCPTVAGCPTAPSCGTSASSEEDVSCRARLKAPSCDLDNDPPSGGGGALRASGSGTGACRALLLLDALAP